MSDMIKVTLTPSPGFCIKTSCLQDGVVNVPPTEEGPEVTIAAPQGIKVFVNICYDSQVPPPPPGSEDIIQRAMRGEGQPSDDDDGTEWFVPVVVSQPREDHDKAGKPSLVFDCVVHTSIKSRAKEIEFKLFLHELALQRVEAQSSIPLSRNIGTPNIKSKGPLKPRTVLIPPVLYPPGNPARAAYDKAQAEKKNRKIIEEVNVPAPPPKSILKKITPAITDAESGRDLPSTSPTPTPSWTWTRDKKELMIKIQMPNLERSHVRKAELDIESRRLILSIPDLYALDINLDLSDDDLRKQAKTALTTANVAQCMALKRNPVEFDIDGARAEWIVAESVLAVHV